MGEKDAKYSALSEEKLSREISKALAVVHEFFRWIGLTDLSNALTEECTKQGLQSLPLSSLKDEEKPEIAAEDIPEFIISPSASLLLLYFDQGQASKFFQELELYRPEDPSIEYLSLEFYIHVYFASLPLRRDHHQDHVAAMAIFRRFLETCSPKLGSVPELLPFYALPYVPEPTQHPAFKVVFQDPWVANIRTKLTMWLKEVTDDVPTLMKVMCAKYHHTPTSMTNNVTAAVVATEAAAEARKGQRVLKKKLQRLQEDYQKLLAVSWELTVALESAVQGEVVDLEAILAACTHKHPDLFTVALSDTEAPATSILRDSMLRNHHTRPQSSSMPALDFRKVRMTFASGCSYEVLLLLQALRNRLSRVSNDGVRQAVLMSYVRGDILGITDEVPNASWGRLAASLVDANSQALSQAVARFLNILASFSAGRNYLAKNACVTDVLLMAIQIRPTSDITTSDICLAALQKLSVRGEIQARLISSGAVEWLAKMVANPGNLSPHTLEYYSALLLNLTLKSEGRSRALPVSPALLPSLTDILATASPNVSPYITGTLCSLLSHPHIRQIAANMELIKILAKIGQGAGSELRSHLEYVVSQIGQNKPFTPPMSPPDSPKHLQDDPDWLEEELDNDDTLQPSSPYELSGEDLLRSQYLFHTAPVNPWTSRERDEDTGRPCSDAARDNKPTNQISIVPWDYPSDAESLHQSNFEAPRLEGTHWDSQDIWEKDGQNPVDTEEVDEEWADRARRPPEQLEEVQDRRPPPLQKQQTDVSTFPSRVRTALIRSRTATIRKGPRELNPTDSAPTYSEPTIAGSSASNLANISSSARTHEKTADIGELKTHVDGCPDVNLNVINHKKQLMDKEIMSELANSEEKKLPLRASRSLSKIQKEKESPSTELIYQLYGEDKDETFARKATYSGKDQLKSLSPPRGAEYVVAFSSRPRIPRTPPGSAASDRTPISIISEPPTSPRSVLPPIASSRQASTKAFT